MSKPVILSFMNLFDAPIELQEEIYIWRNQDFVRNQMFRSDIIDMNQHRKFLKSIKSSQYKYIYVALFHKKPAALIYFDIHRKTKECEFGFYLNDQKYQAIGLGAFIEYCLLDHLFLDLQMERIYCQVLSHNQKIIAMHKRFGFTAKAIDNTEKESVSCQLIPNIWAQKKEKIYKTLNRLISFDQIGSFPSCPEERNA